MTGIYGSYLYTVADSQESNDYLYPRNAAQFTSDDDNKTGIIDIDDEKSEMKQLNITSAVDLELNYQIKSNALPDESGFKLVPMNIYDEPKSVISFTLDLSYDNWTSTLQDEFLTS